MNNIVNISNVKWFPGNFLGFSDLYLQLEGEEEEATIFIPCVKKEELKRLNFQYSDNTIERLPKNEFNIPLTQSIPGFVLQSLIMTTLIIIITNIISEIIKENTNLYNLLLVSHWIESFREIHFDIYMYTILLFLIFIVKKILLALGFNLSMNKLRREVIVKSGGFYKREIRIFTNNIKGIFIEQTLLQSLFNRSTFHIETINETRKSIIIHPFIKDEQIKDLIRFIYDKEISLKDIKWNSNGYRFKAVLIYIFLAMVLIILTKLSKTLFLSILILSTIYLIKYLTIKYFNLPEYDTLLIKQGTLKKRIYFLEKENLNYVQKTKLPYHGKDKVNVKLGYFNRSIRKRVSLKNIIFFGERSD